MINSVSDAAKVIAIQSVFGKSVIGPEASITLYNNLESTANLDYEYDEDSGDTVDSNGFTLEANIAAIFEDYELDVPYPYNTELNEEVYDEIVSIQSIAYSAIYALLLSLTDTPDYNSAIDLHSLIERNAHALV